ncbi:piggyBac transposable element-derived protein 3-like [Coccinella septempunctata]|uniref:piggyBac transposable element-derived protein 3-like n=1 Tax=Coccinella septempunctata TaxID=41139 RepID=UPI001D09698F|nr:piggyBac transposable element-derived protein 3-like [Coccinella septempunctata]
MASSKKELLKDQLTEPLKESTASDQRKEGTSDHLMPSQDEASSIDPPKEGPRTRSRYYTTEELIDLVENEEFWNADIFITPPNDGQMSEEDSDDDEMPTMNINHLSGRQLAAEAVAKFHGLDGTTYICEDGEVSNDYQDWDSEDEIPLAQLLPDIRRKFIERDWKKCDLDINFPEFVSPKVSPPPQHPDAVTCFEVFFDMDLWTYLKEMFVLYATQKGDYNFDITVDGIKCFVGILFLSGHLQVPRWRMLWEVDSDTYNPMVANAMRRNRFDKIKKYVHCADNMNLVPGDKFAKIRPIFDMLNKRFLDHAFMNEKMSIDESMIPYFGRHGTKQFIKGKPIRYGYKVWCLCDPCGYLIQFDPYQGKQNNRQYMELGVGGSVVRTLLSKLPPHLPFKIKGLSIGTGRCWQPVAAMFF